MKHNALENIIFHHYRENEKKKQKAITFLKANGYIVYEKKKVSRNS